MLSRKSVAAATAAAALGFTLLTPLPAMAFAPSVSCDTTGQAPGSTLSTWECYLSASYATNETWSGAEVNPSSQGTLIGKGECRAVTQPNAYYIHVHYIMDAAGDWTTTTSPAFLCGAER